MCSASVLLLSLVLCWGLPSPHTTLSYAAVYYVTPHSPNPDCPSGEPCLTINEYAQGNHFDGDDNLILLFLNGEHNLTAQDFEINRKVTLKMASISVQVEVVIQLVNETAIAVRNVQRVEMIGLQYNSTSSTVSSPVCLSISDIGLLSITKVFVESCQLVIERRVMAIITGLFTSKSVFHLSSFQTIQTVSIRSSEFHFSTFNISAELASQVYAVTSALKINSSSLNNSLVTIRLQTQAVYKFSILNTSITSTDTSIISRGSGSVETGIEAQTVDTAKFQVIINNCNISGNSQGINITVEDKSIVELSVDHCYIANNGIEALKAGGISVFKTDKSNAVAIINITSTVLSGNLFLQISITGDLGSTTTTVFNSTIRGVNAVQIQNKVFIAGGVKFQLECGCQNMLINFTDNFFENNGVEVSISNKNNSKFEFYFNGNYILALSKPTVRFGFGLLINTDCSGEGTLNIANCVFKNYSGTTVGFASPRLMTTIKDSVFQDNKGACLVARLQPDNCTCAGNTIHLNNVTFSNNTNLLYKSGIIQVDPSTSLSIEDSCVFKGNNGGTIQALSTSVKFSGVVIFEDNVAFQGSAISLTCSKLILRSINNTNTNILFMNNTATNTGASIYYDCLLSDYNTYDNTGYSCFYDIQGASLDELKTNVTLTFVNNKAANGGTDVYGATPNSWCQIDDDTSANEIQEYVFKTSSGPSSISSDPKRVCLCDSSSQLMCANLSYIFHHTTRYPGEVFSLPLAVVGLEFGTVTGTVYATLLPQANNSKSSLESGQDIRLVTYNPLRACTQLNFTVSSLNRWETVALTVSKALINEPNNFSVIKSVNEYNGQEFNKVIPSLLLTVPVYINILLLDCPPGFQRSDRGRCECATVLRKIGISNCLIYDSTLFIARTGNQWVGPDESSSGILSSKYCPFNYCNKTTINLNLSDPDKQCALKRTGILCGACPSDLSLAIGGSRCIECSDNYHTLLLIAFAAAGVVLVLVIKILDMTVTVGTVNGLILYANIIWANQSVLFPPQDQTSSLLQFLRVFIAWLNLDLSVETCFIQHLDGYWKTWLQFVFPGYIWLIAGLIILTAHFSTTATKILGNNSVSVLATLFLLAYAKLLRTILIILDLTVLTQGAATISPSYKIVWSFDGNVPYFDTKHSILWAVAITILLFLWLPYTLVLLFIQYLRRHSHYCLLTWVNKLKPFLDSYVGPLKDKHHYWIGLGLLARLVLLLISAITLTKAPFIAVLLITLFAFIFGLLVLTVYKQWQLSALEICFYFNMAMFSSGALFVEAQGGSKDALACTSLGIAFILFLAIVGYHMLKRFQLVRKQLKNAQNGYENIDNIQIPHSKRPPTTYQEVSVPRLRESLLESVTQ